MINVAATAVGTMVGLVLKQMGVPDERVRLEWISASEGDKFVTVVNDMIENLRKLEPAIPVEPHTLAPERATTN